MMKNIFLLVMAMLKGNGLASLGGDRAKKKKRRLGVTGSIIAIIFAGIYMGGLSVVYVVSGFDFLKPLGLQSIILGLAISIIAFLIFFFGLFYVMSVFYFSSDIEKLLPLPITPGQLLSAKFLVTLAYEYLVTLILLLPAMVTYGILEKSGILYYIYMIIITILLPVVPLVMASLIVMLIMRFSPAARNKDRFTLIAGTLAVLGGFGLSFGMQAILRNTESADFSTILSNSADKIARISSSVFPGTYFANYALTKPEGWVSFGMVIAFILLSLVASALLYLAGNLIYFKGVIGIGSSGSKGKVLSGVQIEESAASGNAFITYLMKDIKVLVRTPIFFINNVLMIFLMPVVMIVPMFMNSSSDTFQISQIRKLAETTIFTGDLKIASFILLGFFGFITFVCGVNGISESAISREGNCAYIMKIIPMSYRSQIWAKISVGILLSTLGSLLILVFFAVILVPPVWFIILCFATIPGAVLFPNISGIIFDLYMPKIKWDNEQKAVKQNINILYGILLPTAMIGVMAAIVISAKLPFAATAGFVIIFPLLMSLASSYYVNKITNKTMLQLAA
ncbi:MAG: putative ABC transporter permease subunit [Saccharofermentanales bacterium]